MEYRMPEGLTFVEIHGTTTDLSSVHGHTSFVAEIEVDLCLRVLVVTDAHEGVERPCDGDRVRLVLSHRISDAMEDGE
jgi:hypothetical protein